MNLCNDPLPPRHKDLLDLRPKFIPTSNIIPYKDIITVTEATALKLKYDKKEITLEKLRQDVLRELKMVKPPRNNLTAEQRRAIKEIKTDDNIKIYPFDKGNGLVRISTTDALKVKEQIGNVTIIQEDPTSKITQKIQNK